ncbi:hypothetical protein LMG28138_05718 [Pararobbsia alpina]|uniref:Uncharacterized protein n=1 Tax=Pararobbsia alpina TaxID=621374 RepID=A0A6S7C0Y4_9BURK|nr:hypothetical protein LMG28138_05718 [Pararobbsia alpina]
MDIRLRHLCCSSARHSFLRDPRPRAAPFAHTICATDESGEDRIDSRTRHSEPVQAVRSHPVAWACEGCHRHGPNETCAGSVYHVKDASSHDAFCTAATPGQGNGPRTPPPLFGCAELRFAWRPRHCGIGAEGLWTGGRATQTGPRPSPPHSVSLTHPIRAILKASFFQGEVGRRGWTLCRQPVS